MLVASLVLTLASSLLAQEPSQPPRRAIIAVTLPAEAKLFLDDQPTTQSGEKRVFMTPPLDPAFVYYFTLRLEVTRKGETVSHTKEVPVRGGKTTTVAFEAPTPVLVELPGEPPGKQPTIEKPRIEKPAIVQKPVPAPFAMSREEKEVVDLVNKEREKEGLPPLRPNVKLFQAAKVHSANMAKQQKMDHVLDEKGPSERIREAGYQGFNWGENIAYGMPTPAQAVNAWMTSEGHRANILSEGYNEIGVGIVRDDRGVPYYTQTFGRGR